jgi:hypothetical protein
LDCKDPRAK